MRVHRIDLTYMHNIQSIESGEACELLVVQWYSKAACVINRSRAAESEVKVAIVIQYIIRPSTEWYHKDAAKNLPRPRQSEQLFNPSLLQPESLRSHEIAASRLRVRDLRRLGRPFRTVVTV